jgi:hypothetical protein
VGRKFFRIFSNHLSSAKPVFSLPALRANPAGRAAPPVYIEGLAFSARAGGPVL